jgi:hypothetical protein
VFKSSTIQLDGKDARTIESGIIERGSGIVWRSFVNDWGELVGANIHADNDYLEFSRQTKAVYSIPIRSKNGPLGIFCIDTSEPSNFQEPKLLRYIHHFAGLILIAWSMQKSPDSSLSSQ